jgi:pimeloyl-ACP methyl ester carboxylesterase
MHFTFDRLLILFAVLLALGAMLWTLLAGMMAWGILRPPRMSAGKAIYLLRRLSPGDLGLPFEEQSFAIRDSHRGEKLNIAGWWIPAPTRSEKCVVMLHGYADAKVGVIAWAPVFHDLSFNILAIDLRAHGDSGGRFSTGGFFERDDVGQVIDQLLNLYPDQTKQLVLFGASLGAAIACAVAAQRDDIASIILESPYADYESAIGAQVRLIGLATGVLLSAVIRCAQYISGARFSDVRPLDLFAKIKCPVLMILGAEDELLNADDFEKLKDAANDHPSATVWLVENVGHLQVMTINPEEYRSHIRDFLNVFPSPRL